MNRPPFRPGLCGITNGVEAKEAQATKQAAQETQRQAPQSDDSDDPMVELCRIDHVLIIAERKTPDSA